MRPDLAELPAREVRTDIQGLRAVAVLLVLTFHLWPAVVPGGYVGVDVFFVISGFLITAHLLREPPRSARDVAAFWGRRIRRLLPAALLVIAVTVVAGSLVLPVTRLASLGRDAVASALYVENWALASDAIDYLAADAEPSALQHYWSLGVEEQFYLIWPLLIALLGAIAVRARRGLHGVAVVGVGVFAGASLLVSIVWTAIDPAFAYFATPTRLWELAAGGLLAAAPLFSRLGPVARAVAGWLGIAMIVVAAFGLQASTPFPGAIALIPVVGAVLLVGAESGRTWWSPGRWLSVRPVQALGDTSYAIYLWHFPLIVLGTAVLGGVLPLWAKVVVIVVTLGLAQATRVLVEDPPRRSAWLRHPLVRTFASAALATGLVVALSGLPTAQIAATVAAHDEQAEGDATHNAGCLGAAALAEHGCSLRGSGIDPDPAVASEDRSDAYADECFAEAPFATVLTCEYGDPDATSRIALVGNSHAAQWLPALQELAPALDFSVTTFVAGRCAVSDSAQAFDTGAATTGCRDWGRDVVTATAGGAFDLVVLTAASDGDLVGDSSFEAKVDGYRIPLQRWADAGVAVLVLRDTPQPHSEIPECVAVHREDVAVCDGSRAAWEAPDPLVTAADEVGTASVDLNDLLCGATTCYAVIGGELVYFDPLHLTATFARSLAPYLEPSVRDALRG